jgi:ADP-ribosylglycohydrolase
LAYAAGDAFGVQFEFGPKISGEVVHQLIEKDGWPFGGVSDDTLLSILTIQALQMPSPDLAQTSFIESLRAAIPHLRGLGPTTRAALGLPVKDVERSQVGYSNGGMMRTALVGLAFDPSMAIERREWITALTTATHTFVQAVDCALILSAAFSAAGNTSDTQVVLEYLLEESRNNPLISHTTRAAIAEWESWTPPEAGISNGSLETLLAVIFVIARATSTRDAYSIACKLGGDTDTVAALSGSLFAAIHNDAEAFFHIEWINEVDWNGTAGLNEGIQILINRRSHVA